MATSQLEIAVAGAQQQKAVEVDCHGGQWAVFNRCSCGARYAKTIVCGKEWCPTCGKIHSVAHERRVARILPKAMQIQYLGYFVIEFPDRYRKLKGWCYSKRGLNAASKRIVDVLAGARMGRRGRVGGYFCRGLLRWHWFGDKDSGKWNPHANVLVDGRHLSEGKLEEIKAALRGELMTPDLIVHYSYAESPAEKFKKLEYICRPTFKVREWDVYMARDLFNFRNQRWWGSWDSEAKWSTKRARRTLSVAGLEAGLCPCCGSHLPKWSTVREKLWIDVEDGVLLGAGYYRLKDWPESVKV